MRLAVLASGRGSGFQSFIDHIELGILSGVELSVLITSNPKAQAIERAKRHGIKYEVINSNDRSRSDSVLLGALKKHSPDIIALAGWIRILTPAFVRYFSCKILNIHPALLPAFGGKGMYGERVHEAVIKAGAKISGCTVHFVDESVDGGQIILQKAVRVREHDTSASLAGRILAQEHRTYPKAIQLLADGRVAVDGKRTNIDYSGGWEKRWKERQSKYIARQREKGIIV